MFVEKTPNYSQELKSKREAMGLTLADVFQRTRISVAYLQAIENNEFHLLPVSVYTKNFIKTYANLLEMDSESILAGYEDYLNSRKGIQAQSVKNVSERQNIFSRIASPKTYWGIASVLVIISIVTWLISKQYQSSPDIINPTGTIATAVPENKVQTINSAHNAAAAMGQQLKTVPDLVQQKNIEQSQIKPQLNSVRLENNAVKPSKEQIPASTKNVKPAVNPGSETGLLVINAVEDTWMRIKIDQNPSFQIFLKAGEKVERKAESVIIDVGNAGGVNIHFKDKNMENLGKSGQVVHLRLP